VVIPNPRGAQKLLRGDHVVCYGKLMTLKQLIPRDARGRRKRVPAGSARKGKKSKTTRREPGGD